MKKQVSFSGYTIKEVYKFMWVACETGNDAIGVIVEVRPGRNDDYVVIEWADGGPTEHRVSELADDGVFGITANSLLPDHAVSK